jgi:hypothetical protein
MLSALGEEMTRIKPAEMTFVHKFGVKECHEAFTGFCSLDLTESDPAHDVGTAKCDYCPKLLAQMNGQMEGGLELALLLTRRHPITLGAHVCGHYSINDGRHRVCIAKRKRMEVWAVVLPQGNKCDICADTPWGRTAELR